MIHFCQRGSSQTKGGLWIKNSIIFVKKKKKSNHGNKTELQENKHNVANLKHNNIFLLVASSAGESRSYLV